jgi:O-antigen/teichoic acid export membrane protein
MTETSHELDGPEGRDVLDSLQAGGRVIRGGAMRSLGYFLGLSIALISIPLLTRHLGVADFGRYVTVTSLVTIVLIIADAGLTTVGVREYAVRDERGRHLLMRNLLATRLIVAAAGALGAILFALAAGYDSALIAGVALGGIGLILTLAQQTYVIPLTAELRLGLATLLDLLRQALNVIGIVALVAAGATLLPFFAIPIPVGIAMILVTALTIRQHIGLRPGIDRREWTYIAVETLPAAAASALASLFYRVAIVIMSIIASPTQTGYFSASFRVVEALVAVPSLLVGSAYPLLSRAAETDARRLSYAFQRLFEVSLIIGVGLAMALVLGAQPIIDLIAGSAFAAAVPVLQIQGLAIGATFFVALFGGTLWVVRKKRQLVLGNLVGVIAAVALTGALVPAQGAKGAAIAMTVSEGLLACWLGLALLRSRPDLRPELGVVPKVALALVLGSVFILTPFPDLVRVMLASAAYVGTLIVFRAIPREIVHAFRSR